MRTAHGNFLGKSFVEVDLTTGKAKTIRPFTINGDDPKSPQPMSTNTCFDDTSHLLFACNPEGDFNQQAVCKVSASTPSPTPATITVTPWKKPGQWSITSVQYSSALKAPVVLAQKGDQTEGMVPTQVFL